jgi:hypothetical protein
VGNGFNPKSLANLRPVKPGEPNRNINGTNRWQRSQATLSRFLDEVANSNGDETRFQRILLATYTSALMPGPRGAVDRKLLIEMKVGKAKEHIDLSHVAEHMRGVAKDAADLAIKLLGDRVHSMSEDELIEFFGRCKVDTSAFMRAAERLEQESDTQTSTQGAIIEQSEEQAVLDGPPQITEEADKL